MANIQRPYIKLADKLSQKDYDMIRRLQEECAQKESIALKLELDYKLGANNEAHAGGMKNINELMYFDGDMLIGYMGICSFGGQATLEVNGMVHPEYRNQGVFKFLYTLLVAEWMRRPESSMLLLCDRKSASGQGFIKTTGARYHHSEYEMFLNMSMEKSSSRVVDGIVFRKATNNDAREIARQDSIYFGDQPGANDEVIMLPEEEERKGVIILLAEKDGEIIGKVHLQLVSGVGVIYGLGVLPQYRGKGYGRALLMEGIQKLKQTGARKITLQVVVDNASALHLYQSSGFVETSVMDYYELRKS